MKTLLPKKRRKGVRNENKYHRNVIGNAYSSIAVLAKVQQTYQCKGAERCYLNILDKTRNMWNYLHCLESKNMQDTYYKSLIEISSPKMGHVKTVEPY